MPYPIVFDSQEFHSRVALARHLCALTNRSVDACRASLLRHHDDPAAVLALYKESDAPFAMIGNRTFKTQDAVARHIARYYRIPKGTVIGWLARGLSTDEVVALARERRPPPAPSYRAGEMMIFGWRFQSFSAICLYYRYGRQASTAWWQQWREHHAAGGIPASFPPLLKTIGELWRWGNLDEWNRFSAELEAELPRNCLPRNREPEAVTDEFERKLVDALQPPEIETLRRAALHAHLRRVAEAAEFKEQMSARAAAAAQQQETTNISPEPIMRTTTATAQSSFLNMYPIHPAAERLPPSSPEDYERLCASIAELGLQSALVIFVDTDGQRWLLDGRSRVRALAELGYTDFAPVETRHSSESALRLPNGRSFYVTFQYRHAERDDPDEIAAALNLARRHLTGEQKRGNITELLKAHPDWADRRIAQIARVDHKTVNAARSELGNLCKSQLQL